MSETAAFKRTLEFGRPEDVVENWCVSSN